MKISSGLLGIDKISENNGNLLFRIFFEFDIIDFLYILLLSAYYLLGG